MSVCKIAILTHDAVACMWRSATTASIMSAYSVGATPAALCVAIALEQAQQTHTARPVEHQGCGPASGCLAKMCECLHLQCGHNNELPNWSQHQG